MYALEECQHHISSALRSLLKKHKVETEVRLEIPPQEMGDFAFPCFSLAPVMKQSPARIAEELASAFPKHDWIARIDAKAGYVNFFIDPTYLASITLQTVLERKETYGYLPEEKKKVIIEHTSANPNGPLHVGRARNPIIGDTLIRMFKAAGYTVESQFYLDDLGKQVAILAWGLHHIDPSELPKPSRQKADHQKVAFYQLANERMKSDDAIASQINDIVKLSEQGDQATIDMIHAAYQPVLQGIKESLARIHITLDTFIPESMFVRNESVDAVVRALKQTPYCHEEEGAFYLDMASFGIAGRNTKFFFVRNDGTTLYATRDIAYHQWKAHQADLLVNVLGEDHKLESRQVSIALELLKVTNLPQVVFYAFVSLPEGKMSTRKGRVVYLDDLIDECIERAYQEVKKRRAGELSESKMRDIAQLVGIGSLRYNIIKVQPEKDIQFKWEDALNFEGNAVPFIQYAHARACSILAKATQTHHQFDASLLTHPSETMLIKQLARLPLVIDSACSGCRPHAIANYLYETASAFNQFYRDCPVLAEEHAMRSASRLTLVYATKLVLWTALDLLGVTAPEEM
ncbi:MAG: arginine--tRNA ligase [Candidatus Thermoplasmatota archaeon]|nr:arginine--tRNA ligase [Candidatus Thermoplasmatota archaeon]